MTAAAESASFDASLAALLPLPPPRAPPSKAIHSTLLQLRALADDALLNPMQPAAAVAYASAALCDKCTPWLVRLLAALTKEDVGEEEDGDERQDGGVLAIAAELLSVLAGRAALDEVDRTWVFENAGKLVIREMGYGEAGLGFQTWGSGYVLARLLDSGEIPMPPPGSQILELGSGTGLAGLVCARLLAQSCCHITLTDFQPAVLTNLVHNTTANSLAATATVRKLDWIDGILHPPWPVPQSSLLYTDGTNLPHPRFQTMLVSDCAYDALHAAHIPKIVDVYLEAGPAARVYCVLPERPRFEAELEAFLDAMRREAGVVEVADACRTMAGDDGVNYRILCYSRPGVGRDRNLNSNIFVE
ncbi:hypothetical protein HDU86_003489 [Geranomyces michiganensis]|nr:hypothetical protein HDU86_003489 [Geranomyces michiganensis]